MEKCKMPVHVKIGAQSETDTRVKVSSGQFNLIIDEPTQMGGTNLGPTPVQVMLMALAGCLSITAFQIANEMQIRINQIHIDIEGNIDACGFLGCSKEQRAGFEEIKVNILPTFIESISEELRQQWLEETERRCPVSDTISSNTVVKLQIK
jgi:uncharacterized OsmC-like protein